MVAYAESKGWKKGDYKNLNLPFENKLLAQPKEVRERMTRGVEDFAYKMMTEVLNGQDTAQSAVEMILTAGSFDLGPKGSRIEEPAEWSDAKILEKARLIQSDKGPAGKFDD
jgi:fructose-bisphosphate aldolase class II